MNKEDFKDALTFGCQCYESELWEDMDDIPADLVINGKQYIYAGKLKDDQTGELVKGYRPKCPIHKVFLFRPTLEEYSEENKVVEDCE